jgi:DNA-binding LacI/PurR family transcriptional regulator
LARERVRLADVAAAAGVSLGTASNVFNRPDIVRAEVREHVQRVAASMGFGGPDPAGRLLMGGRAHAIGMIPAGDMPVAFAMASPYLNALLQGVAEICDQHGSSLMVISGAETRKNWAIQNALVDGFVLGHTNEIPAVEARPRKTPFVLMDMAAGPDTSSVQIEGREGARIAAQHLLDLGHRRFAIVAVKRSPGEAIWHEPQKARHKLRAGYPLDAEKLCGYTDALEAAGIPIGSVPLIEAYPPSPWAERGAAQLLDNAPGVTAILAMSDKNALTVLAEAQRRGRPVPDDLSVVGFDDVADAASAQPPLTTIRQDVKEKGRMAARMLFEGGGRQRLPVAFVLRGSTAAPGN